MPFRLPLSGEQKERLPSVLHVLYLIFNEGYSSSDGPQLQRRSRPRSDPIDASGSSQSADDGEVAGLLALMLLTDARREARTGPDGEFIPLDKQDRACGTSAIAEGVPGHRGALAGLGGAVSAAGGDCCGARRGGASRGDRLAANPRTLHRAHGLSENPMVTLNHAIATAMVEARPLDSSACRTSTGRAPEGAPSPVGGAGTSDGDGGRLREAIAHYRAAAGLTTSIPERNYLVAAGRPPDSEGVIAQPASRQCRSHRQTQAPTASPRTLPVLRTARSSARRRHAAPSG